MHEVCTPRMTLCVAIKHSQAVVFFVMMNVCALRWPISIWEKSNCKNLKLHPSKFLILSPEATVKVLAEFISSKRDWTSLKLVWRKSIKYMGKRTTITFSTIDGAEVDGFAFIIYLKILQNSRDCNGKTSGLLQSPLYWWENLQINNEINSSTIAPSMVENIIGTVFPYNWMIYSKQTSSSFSPFRVDEFCLNFHNSFWASGVPNEQIWGM